jgi:hypothetical protein
LASARDFRIEATQLYRDVLSGRVRPEVGCRLAYILQVGGRFLELEMIEARLLDLEKRASQGATQWSNYEPPSPDR